MRVAHAMLTKMEDRSGQNGAGMPLDHAVDKVIERADAAAGDHGHGYRVGNGAGERQIIALPRPVPIHRRDQQFARAQFREAHRMLQRIDASGLAPAMGEDFPAPLPNLARVHGADDTLASEAIGSGRTTAALLTATLSAPARSSARASSALRTPPPTVTGMKHTSAVRRTTSNIVPRASCVAVMSRKQSSSAPAAS